MNPNRKQFQFACLKQRISDYLYEKKYELNCDLVWRILNAARWIFDLSIISSAPFDAVSKNATYLSELDDLVDIMDALLD